MSEPLRAVLLVEFPLGRYHATPWEAHVNEGRVEFPPSCWRLLRALYATWRERVPDLDAAVVERLLGTLAAPPAYDVPRFLVAHTRHYYPDATSREGGRSTDRTIDAFAAIDPRVPLAVIWPDPLSPEEAEALSCLAEALPYLGRADSVCRAWVDSQWSAPSDGGYLRWEPVDEDGSGWGQDGDDVVDGAGRLLCPDLRDGSPLDLDALIERPVELRAVRRLRFPRSSRFVTYREQRPAAPPRHGTVARRVERAEPAVVRFKVTDSVLPRLTDTLKVTEGFHAAAARRLNDIRRNERRLSMLLGTEADDAPMRRNHEHAHFLALPDPERPSAIGELLVWSPGGLAADEVAALAQITALKVGDKAGTNRGRADESDDEPRDRRRSLAVRMSGYGGGSLLPDLLIGSASRRHESGFVRWTSITPYVATGHPDRDRQAYLAKRFIRDAAQARGELPPLAKPIRIRSDGDAAGFERRRFSDRMRGRFVPAAAMVEVEFAEPIVGPLSVGALTHFGLGLFRPALD